MRAVFCLCLWVLTSCVSASMSPGDLSKEYITLGNGYFDQKKYKEALNFYKRARELDNTSVQAGFNLARAAAETGEYPLALELLDTLKLQDPQNLLLEKARGYVLFLQGNKDKALSTYEGILKESPADLDILFNAGITASDINKDESAIKYLEKYRLAGGSSPDALKVLGVVYGRLKDPGAAAAALEEITASGGSYDSFLKLAELKSSQKIYDKALVYYEKALTMAPDGKKDPKVLFALGTMLALQIQDITKALDYFSQAAGAGFNDPKAAADFLKDPQLIQLDRFAALFKDKKLLEVPQGTKP